MDRHRIKEIVAQMTIEEKAAQLTQLNANILIKTAAELTGVDIAFQLSEKSRGSLGSILNYEEGEQKPLQEKFTSLNGGKVLLAFMYAWKRQSRRYEKRIYVAITDEKDRRKLC